MYDDAQDAVAAEYVLGTLSADERDHAEALLAIDPNFADAVRMWERRLGELNVMVEAVEPPPQVWNTIRAEIGEVAPTSEIASPAIDDGAGGAPTETVTGPFVSPAAELAAATARSSGEPVLGPAGESSTGSLAQFLGEPSPAPLVVSGPMVATGSERAANVVDLSRRVARWRRMTMAVGAIAALLAIFVAVTLLAPGRFGFGKPAPASMAQVAAPRGAQLVAALQQGPTPPAFLLTIDPQTKTLIVRRVSATPEAGHSYELWLISKRFPKPRSLGVVGNDEYTQRAIPADFDVDTIRGASYAVSLEPVGGSQTAVPTGPILFTGKAVESVPASAPSAPATPHA